MTRSFAGAAFSLTPVERVQWSARRTEPVVDARERLLPTPPQPAAVPVTRAPRVELPGQLPLYAPPAPVAPAPLPPDARKAAHAAVAVAEAVLLAERGRPRSREHWAKMADAFENRAAAWLLLATASERDGQGHPSRAMRLAAEADTAQARMLRTRLGVAG
jgi:hypothetical protein